MNPIQSINVEEEKQRRRLKWQWEQKRDKEHEKLKRQRISEYERKREGDLKAGMLFKKSDESTSGSVPLFRDPEGIQISTTELRRIKVNIRRNIPTKGANTFKNI
ncbi:uncharacterized protein LOC115243623 [Formica exsecta]|uniref:uncharacterized protein LOC115243623 n=1 Tax=Formica exsecta TaxID=72781 RepID=UPI001141D03D|nr:uncharacterized protein LOC115243623 [Formica exsecta]